MLRTCLRVTVVLTVFALTMGGGSSLAQGTRATASSNEKADAGVAEAKQQPTAGGLVDELTVEQVFQLPAGMELTEEQKKKVEAIRGRWQERVESAIERCQQRMALMTEKTIERWTAETREDLAETGLEGAELDRAVDQAVAEQREQYAKYCRAQFVAVKSSVQSMLGSLMTDDQRYKWGRVTPEEVEEFVKSSPAFGESFKLPAGTELSEEQEQQLAKLKSSFAAHLALAHKQYQQRFEMINESRLESWRQELKTELAELGLAEAELEQAIEAQVKARLERYERFARRELDDARGLVQSALRGILTQEQLAAPRQTLDASEIEKYTANSKVYEQILKLAESVELTAEQKSQLEELKQGWRERIATAQKRYEATLEKYELGIETRLEEFRQELEQLGLEGEKLQAAVQERLSKHRDRIEEFAARDVTNVREQFASAIKRIIGDVNTPTDDAGSTDETSTPESKE